MLSVAGIRHPLQGGDSDTTWSSNYFFGFLAAGFAAASVAFFTGAGLAGADFEEVPDTALPFAPVFGVAVFSDDFPPE
jgi:hypothetical protein